MEILGLSTSPSSGGAYALILSEADGGRRLPIIIGTFEAQAIALEMEHIKPPRPMTHDLLRSVIQTYDSFVKSVFISDLKDGTFFAKINLDKEGVTTELDSRPSDAIALAIRFNAPIFVTPEILDEAGIVSEAKPEDEGSDENLDPVSPPQLHEEESTEEDSRVSLLEKKLAHAISNEDYELAAKIRDEIKKLKG